MSERHSAQRGNTNVLENPNFVFSTEFVSKPYRHCEGKIPVYLNLYHAVIYVSMVIHGLNKYTVISIQQCMI